MAKTTKGKGPGRPKGKRETSKESNDGADSDTSEILRQRILDETRQDGVETVEVGPSGLGGAGAEVEDDRFEELDDDGPTESEEEAARKKKEEAARKRAETMRKKAADKKAEEARKAKKAEEEAREKAKKEERAKERERARERERRKERETRARKPRTRSRSVSGPRRSRSRGRSRSRSGSLSEALRTQVERLSEKVKYMESRKRWSSVANEKQYLYNVKIKQLAIEDVRKQLEDYFGSRKDVPEKNQDDKDC